VGDSTVVASVQDAERSAPPNMVWIPGATFRMGSDQHYPEEAPVHTVSLNGFWIDRTPVSNRQFKEFVRATGHRTFAEIPPDPKKYPGALPQMLYAGSLVFTPPSHPVDLKNLGEWWAYTKGADWLHPHGPKSTSTRATIIPWCMWRSAMHSPTPNGPARSYRPKPNGNTQRVAALMAPSLPGEANSRLAANTWLTPGRQLSARKPLRRRL
jgi:hypothetical protein